MKINGREFRLFGKKDERPLCLVLLSQRIAENAQEAEIPGGAGIANGGAPVKQPEGEGE